MTVKARIILIVIFLIGLFLAVNSVRKKKMQLKYALPWILCSIILMIFAAVPGLLQGLAALMGIYSPVNLIFFLGFIFSLCAIHHHLQNIRPTPAAGAVGGTDGEAVYGGGAHGSGCAYG